MLPTVDLSEYIDCNIDPKQHYIGVLTAGVSQLPSEDVTAVVNAFNATKKGDRLYVIKYGDLKFYACENGQKGYTLMFPEDY